MINKIRTCVHCGRTSEDTKFFARKRVLKFGNTVYKIQNICIACHKDNMRYATQRWNEKNKEKRNEINKKWNNANKDKKSEINKRWYCRGYKAEYNI